MNESEYGTQGANENESAINESETTKRNSINPEPTTTTDCARLRLPTPESHLRA